MRAIPRSLGLLLAAILLLGLYLPTLPAEPLWDDNYFIFWRFSFMQPPALAVIWRDHLWPVFDSLVAMLFQWWGHQALYWRVLNLTLHFFNAYLLAHLISLWRPRFFWPIFFIFLVHPLNVMSVAFIIQLKTLLCTTFLLLALWCCYRAEQQKKYAWLVPAVALFFCSITSKSSSLTYPLIAALGLALWQWKSRRHWLMLAPFLVVMIGFGLKTLTHKTLNPGAPAAEQKSMSLLISPDTVVIKILPPPLPPLPVSRVQLMANNFGSYFLYPLFPWPLSLAHGRFTGWTATGTMGLMVFLLAVAVAVKRKNRMMLFLILAQLLAALPFLGFIIAPYMSYTAVSEQHLYLILPFAIMVILLMMERMEAQVWYVLILCVLTAHYTPSYSSEEMVFKRTIAERPQDLFGYVNLAGFYQRMGQERRARIVIKQAVALVDRDPRLRRDPVYGHLVESWKTYGLE